MNDDRQNKVVSMYNTGKTVNMNYKQQAPDYGDMIRQRAQPVICEPLVRDTLDWLTVSYDWLDSETVRRVLTCLEPQIEQLKAERQIAGGPRKSFVVRTYRIGCGRSSHTG
jgi:hypothetical protein